GPTVEGDCLLYVPGRGPHDPQVLALYKWLSRNYEIGKSSTGQIARWAQRGVTVVRDEAGLVCSLAILPAWKAKLPHGIRFGDTLSVLRKKLGYEEPGSDDASAKRFRVTGI